MKLSLREEPPGGSVTWLGALGFEDRAPAGLEVLARRADIERAIVVRYNTDVRPRGEARAAAARNLDRMADILAHSAPGVGLEQRPVQAYGSSDIRSIVGELLVDLPERSQTFVIDLTALTKIHVVTLAALLSELRPSTHLVVAYTAPERYGWKVGEPDYRGEFGRSVFAPVGGLKMFVDEGASGTTDAVVLFGHEGGRASYACAGLAFSRGLGVFFDSEVSSETLFIAQLVNQRFVDNARESGLAEWDFPVVSLADGVDLLGRRVREFVRNSDADRIVLVPLGPKAAVMQAVFSAVESEMTELWVSYPIPSMYPLSYSEGVSAVMFFDVQDSS